MLKRLVAALLIASAGSVGALTFEVESVQDDAGATDSNPGDGVCSDQVGICTLRAAMEEANARAGFDRIEFTVAGTITLDIGVGRLPPIRDRLTIDGYSAPGYPAPAGAETILQGQPEIIIDGSNLTDEGSSGITVTAGGDNSVIRGLSVVNFPGSGIDLQSLNNAVVVQGNYIGALPDFTPAGNAGRGVIVRGGSANFIGQGLLGGFVGGLGNFITSSGDSGIQVIAGTDNLILGNNVGGFIFAHGNDGYGIDITGGQGNRVGITGDDDPSMGGNTINANLQGGIKLTGREHEVDNNQIGRAPKSKTDSDSKLVEIRRGLGFAITVEGEDHQIGNRNNFQGGNVIENHNSAILLGNFGRAANGTRIDGNTIGPGIGNEGIFISAGEDSVIETNEIVGTDGPGIVVGTGTGHRFSRNSYADNNGLPIDIDNDGVTPNDVDDADEGPNRRLNTPIISDVDIRKGLPVGSITATVTYTVDSLEENAAYPLSISFFTVQSEGGSKSYSPTGSTPPYEESGSSATGQLVLSEEIVENGGFIAAVAIDADGNTSELSPLFGFSGTADVIFIDGFEDP